MTGTCYCLAILFLEPFLSSRAVTPVHSAKDSFLPCLPYVVSLCCTGFGLDKVVQIYCGQNWLRAVCKAMQILCASNSAGVARIGTMGSGSSLLHMSCCVSMGDSAAPRGGDAALRLKWLRLLGCTSGFKHRAPLVFATSGPSSCHSIGAPLIVAASGPPQLLQHRSPLVVTASGPLSCCNIGGPFVVTASWAP